MIQYIGSLHIRYLNVYSIQWYLQQIVGATVRFWASVRFAC